ncbi:MAG: ABC transporter substrate-binding protein [Oscillospiraceae bacterium]
MKKATALVLALALALGLCACNSNSGSGSPAASNSPQTSMEISNTDKEDAVINTEHEYTSVVISLSSNATTLCPYASDGGGREYTRAACFEPLTYTNSQGEWEMVIAREVTSPEPCVYDVEIYDYVFDQAGNHVTASDVVFSYDKFIEDGNNASKVANLASYEATGEYTIRFVFSKDLKGSAQELFDKCMIVTEKAWNDSPDNANDTTPMTTSPVGTSPYALSSFESGNYFEYEYTGNYWQTDTSLISTRSMYNVDKIRFVVYTDRSTEAIALEKGETDCTGGLNYADYVTFCNPDTFEPNEGYNIDVITNNALYYLTFNCGENSPLSDINLRKAICHCIDVNAINYLGFGAGQYLNAVGMANPVWLDYTDKIDDGSYFDYDVDLAKDYLSQSSYKGETLKMLVCQNNSARIMATAIQSYCSAIGINMELLEYDSAVYNEEARDETGTHYDIDFRNQRANYYAWGALGEFSVNTYKGGKNHNFIYDETLQNLYDQMSMSSATEEDYVAFCNYVEEQCYSYALSVYYQPAFTNDRFTNIVRVPQGNFILGACTIAPDA